MLFDTIRLIKDKTNKKTNYVQHWTSNSHTRWGLSGCTQTLRDGTRYWVDVREPTVNLEDPTVREVPMSKDFSVYCCQERRDPTTLRGEENKERRRKVEKSPRVASRRIQGPTILSPQMVLVTRLTTGCFLYRCKIEVLGHLRWNKSFFCFPRHVYIHSTPRSLFS